MADIICNGCGKFLDSTGIDPFTQCECPECGETFVIPLEMGSLMLQEHLGGISCFDIYNGFDAESNAQSIVFLLDNKIQDYKEILLIAQNTAHPLASLKNHYITPTSVKEENGRFFTTEPIMDGYDLSHYDPAAHPLLEIENVIEIMKSVGLGLANAHHYDVAHHKIYPENIHIDARGNVRIKNYFISRFLYEMEIQKNEELFLSPYFISPEMAEKGSEDKSGDLFSFGALFYYMLTGKFPFEGRNDVETVYSRIKKAKPKEEEVFQENTQSNFITPDSVEYAEPVKPIEIRPEIPESISNLIMRLLSYHPKTRPSAPQTLDVINLYQALEDKEHGITAAQKKMVLTKTIMVVPNKKKKKGLGGLFGLN